MSHDLIVVGISEGRVAKSPGELISYALGSCVGICLYDRERQVAGMAHILLPCRALAGDKSNPYKFADSGVEVLLRLMEQNGARLSALTAKLAGGARMFRIQERQEGIGSQNIAAARQALRAHSIPILAQDVGADYGRTIRFSARTGELWVKSARAGEHTI